MDLTTMLVIVMFATIITLGMANTLMAIAGLFNESKDKLQYWVNNSWLLWLFIMHLNMYWYSSHIARVEQWGFPGFLHIIIGPVILFFATSIFLNRDQADDDSAEAAYFNVSRKFFIFFALLQLWIISTDYVFESGFTGSAAFNLALAATGFILSSSRTPRFHQVGAILAWALILIPMLLRGLGIII